MKSTDKRTSKARPQPIYTAEYRDHPVAKYNKNPLIRALPVLPDHLTLQSAFTRLPDFSPEERTANREEKVLKLQQLFRFYIALPRVVELSETLHGMICEGYAGQVPFSQADNSRRLNHYELQKSGEFYQDDDTENGSEFTAALIGIPGSGKSKALMRVSAPYRRVIYHPELDIYQIPALLIEMPYKGISVNALAQAIIRALDKAFPQGDYYRIYLTAKVNAEVLFMDAVSLMQTHYVGALLVDESQNRDYQSRVPAKAVRGQSPLTTLLITATNRSNIPMLMVGTPELNDILGQRMSMLRRTVGRGMRVWKPLSLPTTNRSGDVIDMGEFDVFLQVLWDYQWTKTPFEMTQRMRNIFYYYTQGVPDIIIKLFHDTQLRAIRNGGDEVVSEELIHDVANNELAPMTELTRAMRDMDYERTGRSADLAAYLRLDPHELTFDRKRAQSLEVAEAEDDPIAEEHLGADAMRARAEESVQAPQAKKKAKSRKMSNEERSANNIDLIQPVSDLNQSLE